MLRELDGETMLLLTKAPERFDVQFCKIQGVRADLFDKLVALLQIDRSKDREVELLDVVKHLCVFVAELPPYVRNTKKLFTYSAIGPGYHPQRAGTCDVAFRRPAQSVRFQAHLGQARRRQRGISVHRNPQSCFGRSENGVSAT